MLISAFAEQLTSRIEYNYTQNKFTISGENKTIGDFVTLEILSEGKNFDDYDYMDLLYLNQQTTSESEYKFEVKYKESSGIYNARLMISVRFSGIFSRTVFWGRTRIRLKFRRSAI